MKWFQDSDAGNWPPNEQQLFSGPHLGDIWAAAVVVVAAAAVAAESWSKYYTENSDAEVGLEEKVVDRMNCFRIELAAVVVVGPEYGPVSACGVVMAAAVVVVVAAGAGPDLGDRQLPRNLSAGLVAESDGPPLQKPGGRCC